MKKILLISCLFAFPAMAHDKDSPHADWFNKQWTAPAPGEKYGKFCCTISDGHTLETDEWEMTSKGEYKVKILGSWYIMREDQIVDPTQGGPNPTGHAVIWYEMKKDVGLVIYCFSPGSLF